MLRRMLLVCLLAAFPFLSTRVPAEENLLGFTPKAFASGGTLVLGGSAGLPDEVYDEFHQLAGGAEARIVFIPSAYPFASRTAYERAYGGWYEYKTASFQFLHTDSRDEADTDAFVKPLRRATGVWFGGGAQGTLADLYGGTKVEQAIKQVLNRGGVVGGVSAGASIVSREMIRYGGERARLDRGLGLIQRAVVDQHFNERNRWGRLLGAIEERSGHIGLGIDEDTAVILQGDTLRVMGNGNVAVCSSDSSGTLVMRRLAAGQSATLSSRAVAEAKSAVFVSVKPQ